MDKIFIMLMGVFCLVVAIDALRKGEVKWRSGKVAARRSENPLHFWAHISLYLAIAAAIGFAALTQ